MKWFGSLVVMALAIAIAPRATAWPLANPGAAAAKPAASGPVQPEIAKPAPSGVSTILGSHLFKRAGSKPSLRAVGGSARQLSDRDANSTDPEPSSLVLLGTGLLGLAFVVFRKAKSSEVSVQK